ncbi:MAG: hypothetical protein U1E65_03885 [Myxococcota bacterium]
MSTLPPAVCELLGPTGQQLVLSIQSRAVREQVIGALDACAHAMRALDALNLERFELRELDVPDLSVWSDAAPAVRDALVAVNQSMATFERLFPPLPVPTHDTLSEDDIDAAFSEEALARQGADLDRLVGADRDFDATMDFAVTVLIGMLRQDIQAFTKKLRDARLVSSRWGLLGELQEWKAKTTQCLEAVAAAILRPLGPHHLTELLPRYSTELKRSLQLREDLRGLAAEVERQNQSLKRGGASAVAVVAELTRSLDAFAAKLSYASLWARDKRELIIARVFFRDYSPERASSVRLAQQVEGLSRFLETLVGAISRRPELESYDAESGALPDAFSSL